MSESNLQSAIISALRAIGCLVVPNVVVTHRGRPTGCGTGSPDLFVAIPPQWSVWLEVKTEEKTSKLSAEQVKLHAEWRRAGVRIETVRSVHEAVAVVTAIRFGRSA
jgi:hypothetical protein